MFVVASTANNSLLLSARKPRLRRTGSKFGRGDTGSDDADNCLPLNLLSDGAVLVGVSGSSSDVVEGALGNGVHMQFRMGSSMMFKPYVLLFDRESLSTF